MHKLLLGNLIGGLSLMNLIKNLFIIFILFFIPVVAKAYEVIDVCATYENTGKRYKVEANVYDGSELNRRTNSYNYNTYSKYVVIFWNGDQATVIELDFSYGGVSAYGSSGKDQQGYPWTVSSSTAYCF